MNSVLLTRFGKTEFGKRVEVDMNQYMVIDDENPQVLFEGGYVDCKMWIQRYKHHIGYVRIIRYKDLRPSMYRSLVDLRLGKKV